MTRHAACSCGQLHLTIKGEPSRNAMCHCLACQRRTGAVLSNQARYRGEQVTVTGKSTEWERTADSGNVMTFHFCPTCGSTVFWENAGVPGLVSIAIGNFADPNFPPTLAEVAHPWITSARQRLRDHLYDASFMRIGERLSPFGVGFEHLPCGGP